MDDQAVRTIQILREEIRVKDQTLAALQSTEPAIMIKCQEKLLIADWLEHRAKHRENGLMLREAAADLRAGVAELIGPEFPTQVWLNRQRMDLADWHPERIPKI